MHACPPDTAAAPGPARADGPRPGPVRPRATQTAMPAASRPSAPFSPTASAPAGEAALAPLALRLGAAVLAAPTVAAAAHRLVHALVDAQPGGQRPSRVALGLARRGRCVVEAVSDGPLDDPEAATRPVGADPGGALLAAAMDESMDQNALLCLGEGAAVGDDVALTAATDEVGRAADGLPAIVAAHRALQRSAGGVVASLPLHADGRSVGALTLHWPASPPSQPVSAVAVGAAVVTAGPVAPTAAALADLASALVLVGPALDARRQAEAGLAERLRAGGQRLRLHWQAAERRAPRRVIAVAALGLLAACVLPLPQQVAGRARIEGARQQVLVAPADGYLQAAHVRPGDRVRAGQPLVDLADHDLQLERARWASQLEQHDGAYAASMARGDRTQAAVSLARRDEAQAQLAMADEQLARTRVVAPFDGVVVDGDLSASGGAPLRQGDPLVTIAQGEGWRVVVEVDETEIGPVRPGQPGTLSLAALPWATHGVVVERVVPLARAVDGRNVFEVQARLTEADPALRPGLNGRATLETDRRAPLPALLARWTHRLRVAAWRWFG